jgi:predicted dienelactone hydrolase
MIDQRFQLARFVLLVNCCLLSMPTTAQDSVVEYRSKTSGFKVRVVQTQLRDPQRDKQLSIRISYPEENQTFPLIVWSHGMYGSKDNYQPLVEYWTSRGYIVIQPTHSDSLTLMDQAERRKLLREFNLNKTEDWPNRPLDVKFVLDSVTAITKSHSELEGKIDLSRIGIGGHSFGAVTAQLLAGTQPRIPGANQSLVESRSAAFIAISPNGSGPFFSTGSFATVKDPVLFISGDNDKGRRGEEAAWRREAFDHASPGDKFLVWIRDANHNFGGISGAPPALNRLIGGQGGSENVDHLKQVQLATLVFWDAYLKKDQDARDYLNDARLGLLSKSLFKFESK